MIYITVQELVQEVLDEILPEIANHVDVDGMPPSLTSTITPSSEITMNEIKAEVEKMSGGMDGLAGRMVGLEEKINLINQFITMLHQEQLLPETQHLPQKRPSENSGLQSSSSRAKIEQSSSSKAKIRQDRFNSENLSYVFQGEDSQDEFPFSGLTPPDTVSAYGSLLATLITLVSPNKESRSNYFIPVIFDLNPDEEDIEQQMERYHIPDLFYGVVTKNQIGLDDYPQNYLLFFRVKDDIFLVIVCYGQKFQKTHWDVQLLSPTEPDKRLVSGVEKAVSALVSESKMDGVVKSFEHVKTSGHVESILTLLGMEKGDGECADDYARVIDHFMDPEKTKPEVFYVWIILNVLYGVGEYQSEGKFKTHLCEALSIGFEYLLKEVTNDGGKMTMEASERLLLSGAYWILFAHWVNEKMICIYDSETKLNQSEAKILVRKAIKSCIEDYRRLNTRDAKSLEDLMKFVNSPPASVVKKEPGGTGKKNKRQAKTGEEAKGGSPKKSNSSKK